MLPPGNAICPEWLLSSGVRSVSSTVGSGRATTGTSTAAGLRRLDAGLLPQHRIEIEVAADAHRRIEIGQRRRHLAIEPRLRALEELVRRRLDLVERNAGLHQANSFKLSAGAMAKNSPSETMPNMRSPPTSRSSPSSTRS